MINLSSSYSDLSSRAYLLRYVYVFSVAMLFASSAPGWAQDDLKTLALEFKDATALYLLAQNYALTGASESNIKEAIKYYKEAAKLGHIKSEFKLGSIYYYGRGVEADWMEARKWLQSSVEDGRTEAQYMLGMIYLKGVKDRIPKQADKAFELLRAAADQFNGEAAYHAARMLYRGLGIKRDLRLAKQYTKLAIEQRVSGADDLMAAIELGVKEGSDAGINASHKTLSENLILEANSGNLQSQYELGLAYLDSRVEGIQTDTQAALKWFRVAAEAGHGQAQLTLGVYYYNGELVARDVQQAKRWLQKAAGNGISAAKVLLNNIEQSQNAEKSKQKKQLPSQQDTYRIAAEQGDKEAQFKLGMLYLSDGDGVKQNNGIALKWLERAARQNHTNAQFQTGMLYFRPDGNSSTAKNWLLKAANNDHVEAQYFLGALYYREQEYDQAIEWLDKAFQSGHKEAVELLISLLSVEARVKVPNNKMSTWLEQGSLIGLKEAQFLLGEFILSSQDKDNDKQRAFDLIEKSARKGDIRARYKLAMLYRLGTGVKKNYTQSARWFRQAAEAGHVEAQFELAEMYRQGLGVAKTKSKASKWYKAAAEQGHAKAKVMLGRTSNFRN